MSDQFNFPLADLQHSLDSALQLSIEEVHDLTAPDVAI